MRLPTQPRRDCVEIVGEAPSHPSEQASNAPSIGLALGGVDDSQRVGRRGRNAGSEASGQKRDKVARCLWGQVEGLDASVVAPQTHIDEPVRGPPCRSQADAALVEGDVAPENAWELARTAARAIRSLSHRFGARATEEHVGTLHLPAEHLPRKSADEAVGVEMRVTVGGFPELSVQHGRAALEFAATRERPLATP